MRIDVLGVGFDNVTRDEAVDRAMAMIEEGGSHYVVTPNPEIVEVCRENPAAMAAVSGAELVFVCLGAPKQELWMERWGKECGAGLLCGLGGSLDVFAGTVERAPRFWREHGLEWFYRLCKEPRRAGRMMKLPLFLIHVKREKRRK